MRKSGQRLDQRKIGLARTVLVETLAERNPGRVCTSQLLEKSIGECALANPGLAGDEKKLATARARFIEAARKLRQFCGSPHQPRDCACLRDRGPLGN